MPEVAAPEAAAPEAVAPEVAAIVALAETHPAEPVLVQDDESAAAAPATAIEPSPAPSERQPEPATAAALDVAEISSPPTKPKRGWWRRSG